MLYYFGSGTKLVKKECKTYKTMDGAKKAFDKANTAGKNVTVWDESGDIIMQTQKMEAGQTENDADRKNTANEATEEQVIIPQGRMKAIVACDGSLNIRRSPEWGNDNICGRAVRGQSYEVKEIRMVDGKKMIRTIDDLYLSGESELVQLHCANT